MLEFYQQTKSNFESQRDAFLEDQEAHQALYLSRSNSSLPPLSSKPIGQAQQWLLYEINQPLQRLIFQCQLPPQQLLWLLRNHYHQLWSEQQRDSLNRYIVEDLLPLSEFLSYDILAIQDLHLIDAHAGLRLDTLQAKLFIQRMCSRVKKRFSVLDELWPKLVARSAPDIILDPPFSEEWINEASEWIREQESLVVRLALIQSEMKSLGLVPQQFEAPVEAEYIEQESQILSTHKDYLAEQVKLKAETQRISEGYDKMGLPFENPSVLTLELVSEIQALYEERVVLFERFDRLEAQWLQLGLAKNWPPHKRLEVDVDSEIELVNLQIRLQKQFLEFQDAARELNIACPDYTLPFESDSVDALGARILFVRKWREEAHELRMAVLPWERNQMPVLPQEPEPETVQQYLEECQPFVQRGRWWYWLMTPIRLLFGGQKE